MDRDGCEAGSEPLSAGAVPARMFFLFSNRLRCGVSLLISAAVTILLLFLLGWIHF